ncbi:MAG: IPT/TIG domain-containing protein [Candidatus Saccharimonadales bacterium]
MGLGAKYRAKLAGGMWIFSFFLLVLVIAPAIALLSDVINDLIALRAGNVEIKIVDQRIETTDVGNLTANELLADPAYADTDTVNDWTTANVNTFSYTIENIGTSAVETNTTWYIAWDTTDLTNHPELYYIYVYPEDMSDTDIIKDMMLNNFSQALVAPCGSGCSTEDVTYYLPGETQTTENQRRGIKFTMPTSVLLDSGHEIVSGSVGTSHTHNYKIVFGSSDDADKEDPDWFTDLFANANLRFDVSIDAKRVNGWFWSGATNEKYMLNNAQIDPDSSIFPPQGEVSYEDDDDTGGVLVMITTNKPVTADKGFTCTSASPYICTKLYAISTTEDVTLTAADGVGLQNTVTAYAVPTAITIVPDSGTQAGGTSVTITGSGFDSLLSIKIGDEINGYSECININIISSTLATCTTTASAYVGLMDVVATNKARTATLEDGYTYISELFAFTVDTRMTDTLDTDPSHYSGTATEFRVPTGSLWASYAYDWDVYCDTQNAPTAFTGYSGMSAGSNDGILCSYATAGEYQITIKPSTVSLNAKKDNGSLAAGWLNGFGFQDDGGLANAQSNKNLFKSIDTRFTQIARVVDLWGWGHDLFGPMFRGAKNAVGIPADLFADITLGDYSVVGILRDTFRDFAYNSTTATIPSGLLDFMSTANSNTTSFDSAFSSTFQNFAYNSPNATIPANLFSSIDMGGSFLGFSISSTIGTIPSGLFAGVDTSSATNITRLFYDTFNTYATSSTVGTIPVGMFGGLDMTSVTDFDGVFGQTFLNYAEHNPVGVNDTDINSIWGTADFAGKITSSNASGIFFSTFYNMTSLVGSAQTFIDGYLGGINPDSQAATFGNTSISDYATINSNWK